MTDSNTTPSSDALRAARCCDDYTRRSLLRRAIGSATQRVSVPARLLDEGAESFFDRTMTRGRFLGETAGLVLSLAATQAMSPARVLEQAAAAGAADPRAPILVTIYMDGGNDGLNTLVPRDGVQRGIYERLRARIGIASDTLLDVTDRPDLGWHPSATGLKTLFDAGKLAVLTGVDYPNPTMSHFESEQYFRSGTLNGREKYGWLGRYLDCVGSGNPLEGISVAWGGDGALNAKRAATCSVHDPGSYSFWSPGVWDDDKLSRSWAALGSSHGRSSAYRAAVGTTRLTGHVRQALKPLAAEKEETLPPPPVAYPADYELGEELRTLARLLGAGLGTRVATLVDSHGYDTHDDQAAVHAANLSDLSGALVAWQADIEARGLADRVITLVWSEFGRRAEDNDSGGTDHGAGGLMLALGTRVRGGVHSEGWDLGNLDGDGNLRVTTDFRDVYAALLEGHLHISARDVLTGYSGTPTPFVLAA